jgi:glycosyltransferase involved in cell wall biosynthesis
MRITILQGAFLPVPPLHGGAVEKLWFELGKQFATLGHDVVHISRSHQDFPSHQLIEGVRHLRILGFDMPANPLLLKFFDLIYSLRAICVLPYADILITNTFWMPILQRLLAPRKGLLVVSVERMPKGQMRFYRHVALLRCCSTAVRDRVLREQPQLASMTVVIPNPLPFAISSTVSLSEKQQIILYCGRIHPEKGLELLVRAYATACHLGLVGWTLRIVGPSDIAHGGGGTPWLRSIQQLSSSGCAPIEWLGPIYDQQRLHDEYHRSSLFVYPSLSETGEAMGLAPLEAMAHGSVPIVSSLACFQDFIHDGINGLVFNHRSPIADTVLARLIVALATDPNRRRALSLQASCVRSSHSPGRIAKQLDDLFSQLLEAH